jgi:hypothetical protein
MKKNLLSILSVLAMSVLFSAFAVAQSDRDNRIVSAAGDIYVISAKAGGVNFVEGNVSVARKNGKSGALLKQDKLEVGDRVSTGADGKAEILLNPGSFLRLGTNTEFEFLTTDLESLKLKVYRGNTIFEVYASDEFKIEVQTPKNKIYLIDSGIFRIDLNGANEAVSVWKGKAQVGEDIANTISKGKRAIISGGQVSIVKFDRDNRDALDTWSKLRAKNIAQANKRLQDRVLSQSLGDSFRNQGWGFYESFGLWVYNPIYGTYCFLPFGAGWRSPYGYGYGYNVWDYNSYPWYPNTWGNHQQTTPPTGNTPTTTPTPSGNPPQSAENIRRNQTLHTPPFQRMQGSEERGSGSGSSGSSSSSSDSGGNYERPTRSSSSETRSSPSSETKTYSPPPTPIIVNAPQDSSDTKGKP